MVKLVELSERTELEAFNFTGRGFGCQANITTFLDIFLNLFIILRLTDFPPEVEGGGRKEKKKKRCVTGGESHACLLPRMLFIS